MKEFLYRIQTVRPAMLSTGATAEEEAAVTAHFAYLQRLADEGVVILAGRTLNTDASSFGIVIFQAEDEIAARAIVDNDPAIQQRIMRAELFPYRVALMGERLGAP